MRFGVEILEEEWAFEGEGERGGDGCWGERKKEMSKWVWALYRLCLSGIRSTKAMGLVLGLNPGLGVTMVMITMGPKCPIS